MIRVLLLSLSILLIVVSFPGGAFEKNDKHVRNTALRETHEEIGVASSEITLLGHLDSLPSISGFEVTPFVGVLSDGFEVVKDDREVHKIFGIPFSFFQVLVHNLQDFYTYFPNLFYPYSFLQIFS